MIQFRGPLDSIGALAMLRFIGDARLTGRLRITRPGQSGDVVFDHGQIVAASYLQEHGLAALGALMLSSGEHEFIFEASLGTGATVPVASVEMAKLPAHARGSSTLIGQLMRPAWTLFGLVLKGLVPAAVLLVLVLVTSNLQLGRSRATQPTAPEALPPDVGEASSGISASSAIEPPLTLALRPPGQAATGWERNASPPGLGPDFGPASLSTWVTYQSYRLANQQIGGFAAFGAPLPTAPADVSVKARFRKIAGSDGGAYGIYVRDQGSSPRDGSNQRGQFYLFEVSDRGEVSAWRRADDHWTNLRPWLGFPGVVSGTGENDVRVDAIGGQLEFFVNGVQASNVSDAEVRRGGVGVFVGGDANVVLLEGLAIDTPTSPDQLN